LRIELQRLVFCKKKVPAVAGAFFCLFAGVFEGGSGKACFFGGVFVVNLWWIRGVSW
jgi:hypothetical protein